MQRLSLNEFVTQSQRFDELVLARPDVDHFCSRSDWILPANDALMPTRSPWLRQGEHGFVALMRGQHEQGWTYLQPLEAMWCFACPFATANPSALAGELADACCQEAQAWDVLMLSGLVPGSPLFRAVAQSLSRHWKLQVGPATARLRVDLRSGLESFLARRTRNFRRSLQRASRQAAAAGIRFEAIRAEQPSSSRALFRRILAVEERSWKGVAGVGIHVGGMRRFYEKMLPRLAARGALRAMFARHEDRDVAYIVGGLSGQTYRGLQLSYDQAYEHLSLGNLAQIEQIERLCQEGVTCYDLGQDIAYKRRWADDTFETVMLLAWG